MKRLSDQTLYEILEIPTSAAPEEIARAYERVRGLYEPGSLVTYTLVTPDEAALLNNRIEEAKAVLLDPDARERYDERIGVRASPAAEPEPRPAPAPGPIFTPLAMPAVTPPVAPPPTPAAPWPPPEPAPGAAVAASEERPVSPGLPFEAGSQAEPSPPATAAAAAPPEPAPAVAPPGPAPLPLTQPVLAPIQLTREVIPPELPAPDASHWTGDLLRQVREARGVTVQQLAEKTRITRHHLENIEGERWKALPAPVYLRGILMALARELRLDGQKVARSYLGRMGSDGPLEPPSRR